jgi:hypothetical protein
MARLQQGFAIDEMGSGPSTRSNMYERLMSALGQKRTLRLFRTMSALPTKAAATVADQGGS